jgi:transcriptional regulator with XRE-family HTH domain
MTSAQLRMARAALGWTVRDLAERSGVHRNTISRIESGAPSEPRTLAALQVALEGGGVGFIAENGGGPGVRMAKGH